MQVPPAARPASGQRKQRVSGGAPSTTVPAQQQHQPPTASRALEATLPEDIHMDNILHKLQLLGYARDFCRRKKPHFEALTPCYFVAAQPGASGNEQFFYFTSLVVWLLRLCGVTLPTPKQFDDPNTTLQGIVQGLRSLGFAGPAYAPTQLVPGWGREVVGLLDALLDAVLQARGLAALPRTVLGPSSIDAEAALVDDAGVNDDADAADITSQAFLSQLQAQDSGSSMEDLALSGVLSEAATGAAGQLGSAPAAAAEAAAAAAAKQVLVAQVDPVAWKLEVERVAPKLRAAQAASAADGSMRDWRQHLEAAHTHMAALAATWPAVKSQLDALGSDVAASLERVDGRERQLNSQCEGLLAGYRDARRQLGALQEEHSRRAEAVSERNNELHRVAAALEDAKGQLEARGSNLADATPLVRLKGALAELRAELRGMELRIGVVAHNLVSLSLAGKQAALQDAAKRGGGGPGGTSVRDAGPGSRAQQLRSK